MRKLMPVTIRHITIDRGSIMKAKSIWKLPTVIQSHRVWVNTLCSGSKARRSFQMNRATKNEKPMVVQAMKEISPLPNFFPKRPFIRNPNKGNNGIKKIYFSITIPFYSPLYLLSLSLKSRSPFEYIELVNIHRMNVLKQTNKNGKPHSHLCCSNCKYK